ncbi:MAG: hypothetical protein AAB388_01675 [Patescibacteria group bacterium]
MKMYKPPTAAINRVYNQSNVSNDIIGNIDISTGGAPASAQT